MMHTQIGWILNGRMPMEDNLRDVLIIAPNLFYRVSAHSKRYLKKFGIG